MVKARPPRGVSAGVSSARSAASLATQVTSANVPRILLEEGRHGAVTWVIEQGAVGGLPLLGFQFGCSANAEAMMPSPHQFTYFQGGGFDASLLSFLQIDRDGTVNVSKLSARPHVTAGAGGFVDITARARRIVFSGYFTAGAEARGRGRPAAIEREGKVMKLVPEVEQVSFSGRRARARDSGHLRHRALRHELEADGVTVTEIAPGVDLERDVLARAGFPLRVATTLRPMAAALFRPEPMGRSGGGAVTLRLERAGAGGDRDPRPGRKLNALTGACWPSWFGVADELERDDGIRAVILTGDGDKAFCAGADIAEWGDLPPLAFGRRWVAQGHRVFDRLARLRQPVIAMLNGVALGGGLELAATADLRIAEAHARVGLPESRVGVIPGWSGTQRLVRRAGAAGGAAAGADRRADGRRGSAAAGAGRRGPPDRRRASPGRARSRRRSPSGRPSRCSSRS